MKERKQREEIHKTLNVGVMKEGSGRYNVNYPWHRTHHLVELLHFNVSNAIDIKRSYWDCDGANVETCVEGGDKIKAGGINQYNSIT